MGEVTVIYARAALLTHPDGATTPAVLLVEADGTLIRMLDAVRIETFLQSVRICAQVAVESHEQRLAASPADRALLQAEAGGRA